MNVFEVVVWEIYDMWICELKIVIGLLDVIEDVWWVFLDW